MNLNIKMKMCNVFSNILSVIEEIIPDKCEQCDKDIFHSADYHMKWVHEQVKLEFKCKHCDFESCSISSMKHHLISKHGKHTANTNNFTSSRTPMCNSCLDSFDETPAEFKWPSWTATDGTVKYSRCLEVDLSWWTEDCKEDVPKDVIELSTLKPIFFSG